MKPKYHTAIHVLHENDDWYRPLDEALGRLGAPRESWNLASGFLDLDEVPPQGVFFGRMSASAHDRGHDRSPELAAAHFARLERHGRRVINGSAALRLELSKIAQHQALSAFGIRTPRTVAALDPESLIKAAGRLAPPLVLKPNRGGKGLGVRLFRSLAALAEHVRGPELLKSPDGLTLVQEYIEAPEPVITRLEFIGGRLFYAVLVDASGGFELCPADGCEAGPSCALASGRKFEIIEGPLPDPSRYEALLKSRGVEVAGVEFILDRSGSPVTYDINVNTNYNSAAEAAAGVSAMDAVAAFLVRELDLVREALEGASR